MQKQAELYRGKAKTVYSTENPDLLVLEFRNDTSAGDGARIEQFDRKGMVNNKFNYFIMSKLAEAGIPTQMERLLSDTECLVKKLEAGDKDTYKEYISYCHYKGRKIRSIERRRKMEFLLLYEK